MVDVDLAPLQLSRSLIERYNVRDLDAMSELFAEHLEFVRPGGEALRGREAVRARYELDWQIFDESTVEITNAVCSGLDVAAEIHMRLRQGDEVIEADGAVFHRWDDGLLVRYRSYLELPVF